MCWRFEGGGGSTDFLKKNNLIMNKQINSNRITEDLKATQRDILEILKKLTTKDTKIIKFILNDIDYFHVSLKNIRIMLLVLIILMQIVVYDLYFSEPLNILLSKVSTTWINYPIWIKSSILTGILTIPATVIGILIADRLKK